jgi:hypothetical protein
VYLIARLELTGSLFLKTGRKPSEKIEDYPRL